MTKAMELPQGTKEILTGVAGGLAKLAHDWLTKRTAVRPGIIMAKLVVAAFSSWMTLLFVTDFLNRPDYAAVACGCAGWLGAEGIPMIYEVVKGRLTK